MSRYCLKSVPKVRSETRRYQPCSRVTPRAARFRDRTHTGAAPRLVEAVVGHVVVVGRRRIHSSGAQAEPLCGLFGIEQSSHAMPISASSPGFVDETRLFITNRMSHTVEHSRTQFRKRIKEVARRQGCAEPET